MNTSELKKVGLKATLPRLRILQILESSSERHMSAESVYRALLEGGDDVGLATVYRVLTQFEAAGLVVRHNFDGGHAVFELETPEHHDHMVDVDSGEVVEECVEYADPDMEPLMTIAGRLQRDGRNKERAIPTVGGRIKDRMNKGTWRGLKPIFLFIGNEKPIDPDIIPPPERNSLFVT